MSLQYSTFVPLEPTQQEIEEKEVMQRLHKENRDNIKNNLVSDGYIELKSDYLGMSSYYYNGNDIIELDNLSLELKKPEHKVCIHLKLYNNLL
jgi:hypothetical protein